MREAHWCGVCVCWQASPGFEAGRRYNYEAHWRDGSPAVYLVPPDAGTGGAVRLEGEQFDRSFVGEGGALP